MTTSQRACQILATLIAMTVILGTVINCTGMASKVGGFMYEQMRGD